jgi:hypothetical protein
VTDPRIAHFTLALVALIVLTLPVPASAAPADKDVRVTNAPTDPVPVTVQQMPAVSGSVAVTSQPPPILGERPFAATCFPGTPCIPALPRGKQLIVDLVSVVIDIGGSTLCNFRVVRTDTNGTVSDVVLTFPINVPQDMLGKVAAATMFQLHLPLNGGDELRVLPCDPINAITPSTVATIFGHLVDRID